MTTEAKKAEKKEEGKKAEQAAAKEQAVADLLEADDLFEEFGNEEWHSAKDEEQVPLWEADWEDENVADDFAARLRAELDKGMKE